MRKKASSVDRHGKVRVKPKFLTQPSSAVFIDNRNCLEKEEELTVSHFHKEKSIELS